MSELYDALSYLADNIKFVTKLMIKVMTYIFIVNCPFLDGAIPCRTAYGVYIAQFIRFARVCYHVADLNARNNSNFSSRLSVSLTSRVFFFQNDSQHYGMVSIFIAGLKIHLHQGLSESEVYHMLVDHPGISRCHSTYSIYRVFDIDSLCYVS